MSSAFSWLRGLFGSVAATSGTVVVNGQVFHGSSVSVVNGRVFVDGKEATGTTPSPKINIVVNGDINTLRVDCCDSVQVTGSVGSLATTSGDIECGAVTGDVTSVSGDVTCGPVQGNIKTVSGNVRPRR